RLERSWFSRTPWCELRDEGRSACRRAQPLAGKDGGAATTGSFQDVRGRRVRVIGFRSQLRPGGRFWIAHARHQAFEARVAAQRIELRVDVEKGHHPAR